MPTRSSVVGDRLARDRILDASARVFSRMGFATARVEDVLEAAGVARRTFYKHFRGKDDVLAGIYQLATEDLLRLVRAATSSSADPLLAVRHVLDAYLDYHAADVRLVSALVQQALLPESPLHARRAEFREELTTILERAVRQSTGESHDRMLYAALLSALEGVSLELLEAEPSAVAVERAKAVMRLLFDRALAPRGS